MAYPVKPDPTYDFGPSPVPPHQVKIGFDDHKQSIDDIIEFIKTVLRSDGRLNNLIVTPESLSVSARALITAGGNIRGPWATVTSYKVGDVVSEGNATHIAASAHTSEVFSTDFSAGRWLILSAPYIPGTSTAGTLDTMDDLRALETSPASILLKGRDEVDDGAGGQFIAKPTDTTSVDDGALVVVNAVGMRYWRQYARDDIEAVWWGFKGNGTTRDDQALQAAIDVFRPFAALTTAGIKIILPSGRARFEASINLTNAHGVHIVGAGPQATECFATGIRMGCFVGEGNDRQIRGRIASDRHQTFESKTANNHRGLCMLQKYQLSYGGIAWLKLS